MTDECEFDCERRGGPHACMCSGHCANLFCSATSACTEHDQVTGGKKILVNPKYQEIQSVFGLRVMVSDLIPEDKVFIIDEKAFLEPKVVEPFHWTGGAMDINAAGGKFTEDLMFKMMFRLQASTGRSYQREPDPSLTVPARARDWPAWLGSIVGYEFRKAADRQRIEERFNNRGFAVISGLTS